MDQKRLIKIELTYARLMISTAEERFSFLVSESETFSKDFKHASLLRRDLFMRLVSRYKDTEILPVIKQYFPKDYLVLVSSMRQVRA